MRVVLPGDCRGARRGRSNPSGVRPELLQCGREEGVNSVWMLSHGSVLQTIAKIRSALRHSRVSMSVLLLELRRADARSEGEDAAPRTGAIFTELRRSTSMRCRLAASARHFHPRPISSAARFAVSLAVLIVPARPPDEANEPPR